MRWAIAYLVLSCGVVVFAAALFNANFKDD